MSGRTAKLLMRIATKEAMEWPEEQRPYIKKATYKELKKAWHTFSQEHRAQLRRENP